MYANKNKWKIDIMCQWLLDPQGARNINICEPFRKPYSRSQSFRFIFIVYK